MFAKCSLSPFKRLIYKYLPFALRSWGTGIHRKGQWQFPLLPSSGTQQENYLVFPSWTPLLWHSLSSGTPFLHTFFKPVGGEKLLVWWWQIYRNLFSLRSLMGRSQTNRRVDFVVDWSWILLFKNTPQINLSLLQALKRKIMRVSVLVSCVILEF